MKKIVFLIFGLVGLSSCSLFSGLDIDAVNETDDTLYVEIKNFPLIRRNLGIRLEGEKPTYYIDEDSKNKTSFTEIDEEIFNFIEDYSGKANSCIITVRVPITSMNKYGHEINSVSVRKLFPIDIIELKRYKDYKVWSSSTGGIISLFTGENY